MTLSDTTWSFVRGFAVITFTPILVIQIAILTGWKA